MNFKRISIKIIFWALIPFLFVVSIVPVMSHLTIKNSALDVVKRRDAAFAEIAAVRLSENLQKYSYFLQTIADTKACKEMSFTHMEPLLVQARSRIHFFDGGIVIFNKKGRVVWSYPLGFQKKGHFFPSPSHFKSLKNNLRPVFSDIFFHAPLGRDAILIGVPVIDDRSRFQGVVAGICSVEFSTLGTTYTKVLEFKSGKSSFGYLVDGDGHVLYHRHSSLLGQSLMDQEAVQKVIQGKTGATFSLDESGIKLISGFAPVPGTRWGVITQGNWTEVEKLILFYIRLFTAVLWCGGIVSAGLVFFFIKKHLNPIRVLTQGADRIAQGDFTEIPVRKTGDEIEVLSRQFNSMARALKASFANIKNRVEALDNARTALENSEEKINGIINSVADAMMMIHENGDILWINDKGKELFGSGAGEKKYVDLLYPNNPPPGSCIVKNCFATGIESDSELKIPVNGKIMDFWCTSNVVLWAREGTPRRVVLVCRNLAEKKRMREEVLRNAQLAALGELAAGVAHEINNPINGIINYAQIIEDTRGSGQEDVELPQRIIAESMRIANIVSKLLSFAREGNEEKEAVNISEIIDDVLDLTQAMVKKDNIKVIWEAGGGVPLCHAVTHQVQQIFLNIIGNARYALNQKFSGSHARKELIISCESVTNNDQQMVRTVFMDRGIGIPEKIMDKLCNPFFSTKPPGHGTGLGLSISYGIIEEHRGELNIESVEGEWTKVSIDLPIAR
ncbi:PAS domain-containing sensor histidine kinase [Desulfocicer vacuolatum]|nr:PAS domain-containing sensor histidine kinase [Desulfocicer vacuolatum]